MMVGSMIRGNNLTAIHLRNMLTTKMCLIFNIMESQTTVFVNVELHTAQYVQQDLMVL